MLLPETVNNQVFIIMPSPSKSPKSKNEEAQETANPSQTSGQQQSESSSEVIETGMAQVNLNIRDYDDDDDEEEEDDDDEEEEEQGDDEEDFMSMMPKSVRSRVEKLKELNTKREAIMVGYLDEIAALELKYAKMINPLYEERKEIVMGNRDNLINSSTDTATKGTDGEGADDDDDANEEKNDNDDVQESADEALVGIPEFWACAIGNFETVAELVTERDNEALLFLEDVSCKDFEDGKGFILSFQFKENPFFHNKVLTKSYEVPNLLLDDEPILKNVSGCDINWKPNMCLTYEEVSKKQRKSSGKKAGQIRTVTKREQRDSFFHFFSPPKIPTLADDMDEEEADAIEEAFDHDYDVAQAFRSHIIPKAVLWFTGEAMEEDMADLLVQNVADGDVGKITSSPPGALFPPPQAGGPEQPPECKQS